MNRQRAGRLGYKKTRVHTETWCQRQHDEAVARHEAASKICRHCGEPIPYEKRNNDFCNRACWREYPHKSGRAPKAPRLCACGNPLGRNSSTYCSLACQQEQKRVRTDALIRESGSVSPHYIAPRAIKAFLLRERGNRCELCDGERWQGQPMPLVLDHVNGDSSDNSLVNLRLACGNCDMLLPTYKGRNRGNGRHTRRQRYARGESF
jgi:hypothetical protein